MLYISKYCTLYCGLRTTSVQFMCSAINNTSTISTTMQSNYYSEGLSFTRPGSHAVNRTIQLSFCLLFRILLWSAGANTSTYVLHPRVHTLIQYMVAPDIDADNGTNMAGIQLSFSIPVGQI